MNELQILTKIGPFSVTAYGLLIAAGALAGGAAVCLQWRRRFGKLSDGALLLCGIVAVLAVFGARLVYCATMVGTFAADYEEQGGLAYMLQIWEGGYALYGAVIFGALGGWLFARKARMDACTALDLLAPGAALALCFGRAAEFFTQQGIGTDVEDEALWFFPVAMEAEEGWWVMPVFAWEAIIALVIAVVLLLQKDGYPGRKAGNFIVFLGLSQIMMDSLRKDEFLRFGFVHFNQLAAATTVLLVLILREIRCRRAGAPKAWQNWRYILFVLGALMIIAIEFGLDKSTIDNLTLYIVMALTLVMMGFALQKDRLDRAGGEAC